MKEYTTKEIKLLQANSYTYNVTKTRLFFTKEFKQDFWIAYQAGMAPRKILEDFGYDLDIFAQKQIDSIVQHIKKQAQSDEGFTEGYKRNRRKKDKLSLEKGRPLEDPGALDQILIEVKYLRQEVDFLKKISKIQNSPKRKS